MNLTDCCVHEKKITIFLTDEIEQDLFAADLLKNSFALMSLFGNEVLRKHKRLRGVYVLDDVNVRQTVYPVTTAIVAVSHANHLKDLLEDLKDSIWWNHEANFIIVNMDAVDSCQMARTFLTITWAYNMLSVLYLCTSSNGTSLLYAFNPFTDSAPECWNKVQDQSSNKYGTLFESSYDAINPYFRLRDSTILLSKLFFDKIKNLNGYNLKVVLRLWIGFEHWYNASKSGYDRYSGINYKEICTVLSHLNATVTAKFSNTPNIIVNKKLCGMAKDVIEGPLDILMNWYMLRDFWKVQAHSFDFVALKFVSLKMPVSYADELTSALTFKVCISLLIIYIALVEMLKFILKVSTSSAALEVARICTQCSTLQVPRTSTRRILLIICIIVAFTFSSFVQSLLNAISTTKNQFSTIDTVDDLINCHLPIFVANNHKELIAIEEIRKRIFSTNDIQSCFDQLQKSDQVVCLQEDKYIDYLPKSDSIHISTDNLFERSNGYIFSEDSPFLQKCNSILMKLNEGGFKKFLFVHEMELMNEKYDGFDKKDSSSSSDLIYFSTSLYILATSWLLGIVFFCFELLIPKIRRYINSMCNF